MSIYYVDGDFQTITDYDIMIESEYYDRDYDDISFEEPIDNEINIQTDIVFE